ncbi:MAG: Hsp20/alpha crystallin family protein [Saprospiraceae bacterium]|nr:Hsp20/alpha crystallin family protein [Saprospiraceae bacterium]
MHNTIRSPRRNRSHRNQGFFAPSFGNIINEILNSPLNDVVKETPKRHTRPAANIIKTENVYTLSIALPGVSKKDVQINIDKNRLTIKSSVEENSDIKYKLREFNYANFERVFKLSDDADIDNISAKFEKGILNISIPTIKEAGPTEIKIK